jgi:FkbH-like protein
MRFSPEDVQNFAAWSADRNPLHVDAEFARETHFGRPIVHGVLTVLEALRQAPPVRDATALDIEFRNAVVAGEDYELESEDEGGTRVVTLRQAGQAVLTVRVTAGAAPEAPHVDAFTSSESALPRAQARPRAIEELERGVEVVGAYPMLERERRADDSTVSHLQARVLALCSYVTGMELPGLKSLFTRITVHFHSDGADGATLRYRARTSRFDRQFRLLDTTLDVVSSTGIPVATATLRSYVPFSPSEPDVALLARNLAVGSELLGKVALVVGASRGLGAEIAAGLALAGCHVYASARQNAAQPPAWVTDLAARGARLEFVAGDARDDQWGATTRELLRARHRHLDAIVLNACEPPRALRFDAASAARHAEYVRANLALVETPLAVFADLLDESRGRVVCISSSFVQELPPNFGHYVAVKQAAESLTRTVCRERPRLAGVIARPPVLQTRWNDTPAGVIGSMAANRAAVQIVNAVASATPGNVTLVTEFPALQADAPGAAADNRPDFTIRVAASFTTDALQAPLQFWAAELDVNAAVTFAPYGQVLQSLLDPGSLLNARGRGASVVLLRVRDWLRELTDGQAGDIEFLRSYLQATLRDFERALRSHRAQAAADTLLVICPSHGALSSAESILVRQIESDLTASLEGVPGLQVVAATAFHSQYQVDEDEIYDALRDEIAHIPYRDEYLHVLAAIVARHLHRRVSPLRKVVVVDCDNTLWRGVVGEVGAEGLVFDEGHQALHRTLNRLIESGVLVCLCSKNEESDVWRVFDTRGELLVGRGHIVAAAINWQPKSQNLRGLAARLNLGLDSFVFVDDNPVECAEVRAGCPEVLTIQWPEEASRALQLLQHVWEFDPRPATREDARRTEMYREELQRQELRAGTLTFESFIESLQLTVDFSPLAAEDVRRSAQLTLRTNQFNFTTIRREEGDLQALLAAGRHEIRTVRVRDRFGDYGLVGLVIAERGAETWTLDTFLLSCRVLGRGVEHRILADLGAMALAAGARAVKMRIETTKRNRPARAFLEPLVPAELTHATEQLLECEMPAESMSAIRFEPAVTGEVIVQEDGGGGSTAPQAADAARLRRREQRITRAAFELASGAAIRAAAEGRPAAPRVATAADQNDVAAVVHAAFASALRLSVDQVAGIDRLEALGCDSLKIVEITVALSEKYPWLPGTLLFEHRSVRDIIGEIAALSTGGADGTRAKEADRALAPMRDAAAAIDIAVVGLHVRTAGANSPQELWDLLSRGASAVRPVPPDREHFLNPLADTRPHWAGLLDDPARFDAELLGVSPREAEFMDPQLRLFLEVAWSALEDAGCLGETHDPDIGVFAGVMYGDYGSRANLQPALRGNPYRSWEGFSLANRLSQLLGFAGPSLAVDTACSSSGTAIHLACSALRGGECRAAVVGGVNLILDPDRLASLGRLGILSERGRCEPFGADADGTVLGEGVGVVVLRTLEDALGRGDRIYGVIKGTGLSTGSGTVGFTAPNPQAQAEAIRHALARARVDPRTITYVETHGTGTHLGDPIEVRGLTLGYGTPSLQDASLALEQRTRIGSIKPNIGHLEAGAGVMGLIKVLLQLRHGMLLPSITSTAPNPQILFAKGAFDVQTTLEPWRRRTTIANGATVTVPRRAAVSSFGVGGANAHVIVEEPPATATSAPAVQRPAHLLALSARSESALTRQAAALESFVESEPEVSAADLCFSVNTGRKHFPHRLALVGGDRKELLQSLQAVSGGASPRRGARGVRSADSGPLKIAFLFTGQGSQYAGMGRQVYETQPVFRDALDRAATPFDRLLERPLLELLFAEEGSSDAELLNQTGYTQPALFAFQYALSELWASWGIRPDIVMGHSVGEIAALCVAGGVSLDEGLTQIAARGRLMQALPAGGTMTSVMADEARVIAALAGAEDLVTIAAINAPEQVVISGDGAAVARISARLTADGIKTKSLAVSHAFHSPLMRPMLAEYERVVRQIRFVPPRLPFVSCVEGELVQADVTRPDYWLRQVMDPVRFVTGMKTLQREQVTAFVEIGPNPVLLGMGRQCLGEGGATVWLPSMRRESDTWQTLLGSLSALYAAGAAVDWKGFDRPYARQRLSVPGYDFSRRQYWLKGMPRIDVDGRAPASTESSQTEAAIYHTAWRKRSPRPAAGRESAFTLCDRSEAAVGQLPEALARALRAAGAEVTVAPRGASSAASVPARGRHVYLAVAESGSTEDSSRASAMLADLTETLRALVTSGGSARALWVVTRRGVSVDGTAPVNPLHSMLWGFGRTASLEHPEHWGGLIDIDETTDVAALARELMADDADDQIALRGQERLVPRLAALAPAGAPPPTFSASGTFVVTGGTGALGLRAAAWLVDRGARHLVLTSRRASAGDTAKARIQALEQRGAKVNVVAGDVSDAADVDRLLREIGHDVPLRGVVHAAGIDTVVPLQRLNASEIEEVIRAKVVGGQLLHDRTRSLDLDLFLCFSSVSAIFGSQGRAAYSAGNAFLDGLVEERRRLGLRGTSINWGPWAGGGMATETHLEQFERVGNRGLRPEAAIGKLDTIVAANIARAAVMDIDWPLFSSVFQSRRQRPLIDEVASEQAGGASQGVAAPWLADLEQAPADERQAVLAGLLRAEVADTLGFEDASSVAFDRNFYELGMDSLMMADFVSRLKQRLGASCTALVFNHPNIAALSARLVEEVSLDRAPAAAATSRSDSIASKGEGPVPLEAAVAGDEPRTEGYSEATEPEVFAFHAEAWPHREAALVPDRWRWMFLASARRIGVKPRLWLHRQDGRIVGHMGSIAVRARIGAEDRDTGWLVDTMVLPAYRDQAVGSRLMVEAHDDQPFSLSLGQTSEMREIQLRLGWKQVAPLQIAQLVVRADSVLKGKLPRPAAWAAGLGFRASGAVRDWFSERALFTVRPVDRFDERHDELWESTARDLTCAVVRDSSYLNWKYVDQPGQRFARLDVLDGPSLRGVAVWMVREPDRHYKYRRAFLVDLVTPLADDASLQQVVRAACAFASELEADALLCHHIDARLTRALRACGFTLRKPERFLLVDPGLLPPAALAQLLSADNWYVTQGDSDVDRPW